VDDKEIAVQDRFSGDTTMRVARAAGIAALIVAVYLLLAYGTYTAFTSQTAGGNDFYPRWRGTRALILEGRDPYSEEVTLEIQKAMYGRPAREDEDQVAFAYPLYVSLLLLPFSLLPYPMAQAFWISTLILALLAALVFTLRTLGWVPSPLQLAGLALWSVLFYPSARSLVLGQVSIVVLALLALSLWAMRSDRPFLAGCALALSTMKPQMVFLVVPLLLLLAARRRQHTTLVGFAVVLAILLGVTSAILPTWIPSFVRNLASYQSYTSIYRGGMSPVGYLVSVLLPAPMSAVGTFALSLGLGAGLVCAWLGTLTDRLEPTTALSFTVITTLLLPGETGTTNQVLLLLPVIALAYGWYRRRWLVTLVFLVLLVCPWLLFLLTVQGNLEHPMMVLPLPLTAMVMLLWGARCTTGGKLVWTAPTVRAPLTKE
jgi:hypothetical protein